VSVKTKAVKGALKKAIFNAHKNDGSGGTTDGVSNDKAYLAEVVEPVLNCDGTPYSFQTMRYGQLAGAQPHKCFVYKILLKEQLGDSDTGTQLLNPNTPIAPFLTAGVITQQEFENISKSLLPEAVFVQDESIYENPAPGDEVEAFNDSGIEGRYKIELTKKSKRLKKGFQSQVNAGNSSGALAALFGTANTGGSGKSNLRSLVGPDGKTPVTDTGDPRRVELILDYVRGTGVFAGADIDGGLLPSATRVSSDYGHRSWGMHNGIDIGVPSPPSSGVLHALHAPCDGIVQIAAFQDEKVGSWKNGNYIKFKHTGQDANGVVSMFLHLYEISEKLRPYIPGTQPSRISDLKQIPIRPEDLKKLGKSHTENRIGEQRLYEGNAMTRKNNPKPNITVKKGEILGYIGNSGRSQATHLHWQWSGGGDPYDKIKTWALAKGSTLFKDKDTDVA